MWIDEGWDVMQEEQKSATGSAEEISPGASEAPRPGLGRTLWRVLLLLHQPRQAARAIAREGEAFWLFVLMVSLEAFLVNPLAIVSGAVTLTFSPRSGLTQIYSTLVQYGARPAFAIGAAGLLLYALRRNSFRGLYFTHAMSLLVYAWLPHLAWVCVGALAISLGSDWSVWPQIPAFRVESSMRFWRVVCEWLPFVALGFCFYRWLEEDNEAEQSVPSQSDAPALKRWAAVIVGGLLVALVAAGAEARERWGEARPLMPGDRLPAFSISSIDSGKRLGAADVEGSVAIIDFWATWCAPCVAAMPYLADLHRDFQARGLKLVSVNVEPQNLPAVRAFMQEKNLPFEVFVDRGPMRNAFKVRMFPTLVVVNRDGLIQEVHVGATSMVTLRQNLEKLLPEN